MLAAPGVLARDQRGEDARRHEEHRGHARHRHVQEDRAEAPSRLLPLLPAGGLHERVVPGPAGEAVTLGIRRARAVDEPRVLRVQRVEPDAEPVGHTGAERLDEHVGVGRELVERGLALGMLEVERHRSSRPVPHRVARVAAERVTAGRLDLDHVGALLGEHQHAERTGDPPRQVEHA